MGKLSDVQIRSWIKKGERFAGKSDGGGLYLRYRPADAVPAWIFRYRLDGKQRVMVFGNYRNLSLADARKEAKSLSAQVALGFDVAAEKQKRKAQAAAEREAQERAVTVASLADEYFERMVLGHWKHPNIVRSRIEKDIKPSMGRLKVEDVRPRDIDSMLQKILERGAPTVANDVLRWMKRIFNFAVKRHMCEYNPAAAFDLSDAGGRELARARALSRDELVRFFKAMRRAKGFSRENELTLKLLLLLAVRKQELTAARWDEFDLNSGIWYLPAERTKTGAAIAIPLPALALEWLSELKDLACGSGYVLPARKRQDRMLPHIHENTLNVALAKVKHGLEPFTIHDLRRTARTQLSNQGVLPHVGEKCLNHNFSGVSGRYDRFEYFEQRKEALEKFAGVISLLERDANEA